MFVIYTFMFDDGSETMEYVNILGNATSKEEGEVEAQAVGEDMRKDMSANDFYMCVCGGWWDLTDEEEKHLQDQCRWQVVVLS